MADSSSHSYQIEVLLTEDLRLIRWTLWFLNCLHPWRIVFVGALFVISVLLDAKDGNLSSISILNLTLLASFLFLFLLIYGIGRWRAVRRASDSPLASMVYTLDESGIKIDDSISSKRVSWDQVSSINSKERYLVFYIRGRAPYLIPRALISGDMESFLKERIGSRKVKC